MHHHWNSPGVLQSRAFWVGVLIGAVVLPALVGGQRALVLALAVLIAVALGYILWRLVMLLCRGCAALARGLRQGAALLVRAHQKKKVQRQFEEASERREEQQAKEARRQRRRLDARARCERVYALHAPEISERFPRELFQRYLERYLGDDVPARAVERRAMELQQLIANHVEEVRPDQHQSLGDVFAEYERKRSRIESSDLSLEWKASLLDKLKEQHFDLFNRALEDK